MKIFTILFVLLRILIAGICILGLLALTAMGRAMSGVPSQGYDYQLWLYLLLIIIIAIFPFIILFFQKKGYAKAGYLILLNIIIEGYFLITMADYALDEGLIFAVGWAILAANVIVEIKILIDAIAIRRL